MEPAAESSAATALGSSLEGLSDEVVELLIAMKQRSATAATAATAATVSQHEAALGTADDPPGFWTTSSESESEQGEDEGVQDAAQADPSCRADASGKDSVHDADDLSGSVITASSKAESSQDKSGLGAAEGAPLGPGGASGEDEGNQDPSPQGAPTPAPRPHDGRKPTVEAQLNQRRRLRRMADPWAGSAFASSQPQLWLALQVGLDANGCIDSSFQPAVSLPSPEHGSIAEVPLGERPAAARSTVPFGLESELDLAAVISPSYWAPAPLAEGRTSVEQTRADLQPLLRSANRAVRFAQGGALRSAALTLQTITDNLFINCERYGPSTS